MRCFCSRDLLAELVVVFHTDLSIPSKFRPAELDDIVERVPSFVVVPLSSGVGADAVDFVESAEDLEGLVGFKVVHGSDGAGGGGAGGVEPFVEEGGGFVAAAGEKADFGAAAEGVWVGLEGGDGGGVGGCADGFGGEDAGEADSGELGDKGGVGGV